MRRFFILLLVFLLPVQVFAGIGEFRAAQHGVAISPAAAVMAAVRAAPAIDAGTIIDAEATGVADLAGSSTLCLSGLAGDLPLDESGSDTGNHAGFGDETVLSGLLNFHFPDPVFISVLRDDAAPVSPYLPPAARPPRA